MEILARLEHLERQARTLRRICTATTLALVAVTAIGAAAIGSGAISTRQLTITDASGTARVKLDANGLHVLDARGRERISAAFDKTSQPSFSLKDATGRNRFYTYLDAKNNQAYEDFNDAKYPRMILGFVNGKFPQMWFGDNAGNRRAQIGMQADTDVPFVGLGNANGTNTDTLGPFGLSVASSKGVRRLWAGLSSGGTPQFQIFDESKDERAFFGSYSDGTEGTYFKNSSGTVLWRAP